MSVTENSSAGLFLLRPDVSVTVTREEHHQQAFTRYPVAAGMSRRVAVELTWCDITSGKYKGERAIEVRLDGYRVGELTYAMSQRYGPIVDEVAGRGRLAGCEGWIFLGKRGTEIQLLLPNPTSTIPMPRPPMAVAPQVAVSAPAAAAVKPGKGIFARHKPAWIAGGVVGVLLIAAIAGQDKSAPSADSPVTRATATAPSTTTSTSTSTVIVPSSTVESPVAAPPPPPVDTKAAAPPKTTSSPKPPTSAPKPPPPPKPPVAEPPKGKCDPNYSGCVPVASDVDCAGGSGNGPAYVQGPIQVIGKDIYGLDADHDGTACE
jgi:hypothetical protein